MLALIVPKKDGKWRLCVDNQAINMIIIKYQFLMTQIENLIDKFQDDKLFSNIDLCSGYHQIQIWLANEWKIEFKIRERFYKWRVLSFGICNAPSTFRTRYLNLH